MSKFKVGDKVRIVTSGYSADSGLTTGSVHKVIGTYGELYLLKSNYSNSVATAFRFTDDELEHYTSNELQVGETYTSHNGSKWECIFIRDCKAWMIGIYPDGAVGNAYAFDIDGTASWAGGPGSDGYNIKWEPNRETKRHVIYANGEKRDTEFDVVDGAVDWDSLRVLPCD